MIVDAHFHCWRLARGDYGWLTPALAPLFRDVAIEDWQREALFWKSRVSSAEWASVVRGLSVERDRDRGSGPGR